jgi:acyl-CoA dehydrogenase
VFNSPNILDRQLPISGDLAELTALEEWLASFVSEVAAAGIDDTDEDAATVAYVQRLATAGLLRLLVPAEHGGAHPQVRSTPICLVRQWLARHSGALDSAFVMQGLGSLPVTLAGSDELRADFLPKVAAGQVICAFALTEPGAGSDVSGMATKASPSPGGWRLDGRKCFITNAGVAHNYVVFAREASDDPAEKPRYGAFWVPADAPGLTVDRSRVTAPHPIGTLDLHAVQVPAAHRIGAPGQGMRIALGTLDVFRVTVGAAALGLADRALDEATRHLSRRSQFGKPLAHQQGLRFALADVATDHVAAQMLVYRAAGARDSGNATPDMAAMAKMYATESAQRAVDRAVQSLGGLGVTVGQRVEALYREVRALRIYEGTTEIQKLVIARSLF